MLNKFIGAMLLFTASVSWGAPEIAYTQLSGKTTNVYLANSDGSNAVRIYSANKSISDIDLSPAGDMIVFSESGTLKLLSLSISGSNVTVVSSSVLDTAAGDPDFSPDGTKVLYIKESSARQIMLVSVLGGVPKTLMAASGWAPTFLYTGDKFVHYRKNWSTSNYELELVTLDSNDDVVSSQVILDTASQSFKAIEDIDTARTRNSVLITANYPTGAKLVELNIDANSLSILATGIRGHFALDDSKILYTNASKDSLFKLDLSSSVITKLNSKKSSFSFTDYH